MATKKKTAKKSTKNRSGKKTATKKSAKKVASKKTTKKVVAKKKATKKNSRKSAPKKTAKKVAKKKAAKKVSRKAPAKKATKKAAKKKVAKKVTRKPPVKKSTKKKTVKKVTKKSAGKTKSPKQIVNGVKKAIGQAKPKRNKKLSAADRRALLDALHALRERVVGEITFLTDDTLNRSATGMAEESAQVGMHMADHATDHFEREFALNLVSAEHDVLYEIDQALRRIDDRTYGVCEECGCSIEKARLEALPFAKMCIRCKSEKERGSIKYRPLGSSLTKD